MKAICIVLRLAAVSGYVFATSALAANEPLMLDPGDMQWVDAPPSLPAGAKLAVLQGDPGKSGPYVMRVKMPGGYRIAPHWHSGAENLTVISGALYLGMGEKAEPVAAHALKSGAFHYLPARTAHFAFTRSPTVVQVHGEGPFDITYLRAADNPQKTATQ